MSIRVWFISIFCVALVAVLGGVAGAESEKEWSPAGGPPRRRNLRPEDAKLLGLS